MPRRLESITLQGPAGRLEALLEEPDEGGPRQACLVCHPHPLHGGTMHNKVVYRIARGLRRSGAAVLRFNFRGVGASEGAYGHGEGEIEDARTALRYLRQRYAGLPWCLAGFSFGSRVVMRLICESLTPRRVIAAGFPTRLGIPAGLEKCPADKVFVQSTEDQYGPRNELTALFAALAEPKRLIWVEAQNHFFAGALDQLEEAVRSLDSQTER